VSKRKFSIMNSLILDFVSFIYLSDQKDEYVNLPSVLIDLIIYQKYGVLSKNEHPKLWVETKVKGFSLH
jgi:hypothetical protein